MLWVTLTGHSCRTLLWNTLMGHSRRTLLWDTLVRHSCRTLLWVTLTGHCCGTLLWDTLVGHSYGTLLWVGHSSWDTLVGHLVRHSFGTPLWDTLVGHSCRTLFCRTLFWVTLVGSSCGALFWDTLDTTNRPAHSDTPRLHQHASRSPVARCHANTLPTKAAQIPVALRNHERNFATRSAHTLEANISHDTTNHPAHQRHAAFTPACFALPSGTAPRKRTFHLGRANPNGTATSRTSHDLPTHYSVSYETSSKSHVQSPKRAFRTRLPPTVTRQVSKTSVSYETSSKTHMSKSARRAFRARLPPKVKRKHPLEHTHHAALPSSFAIPAPPNNTRSHANPNVAATFTSTTTHNLTIPCACHEPFRAPMSNAHKALRLP